jgi:hypothetical protein
MKKRSLLLILTMVVTMLFSACGEEEKPNPFLGKWSGNMDLTDHIVEEIIAQDQSLKEYAEFENLMLTLEFEFSEEEVALHINDASAQQFISNIEAGVTDMIDAMVADTATEYSMTAEDVYAGMGVTRENFIQSTIDTMHLEQMINAITEALALNGKYQSDDEKIIVFYEDNTYEEMKYSFEGDKLFITASDGADEFVIECTKAE